MSTPQFEPDQSFVITSLQSELARAQQRAIYLGACLQQMQTEAQLTISELQKRLDQEAAPDG